MSLRFALAVVASLTAGMGVSAEPPEKLLPPSTQLYVRWDGIRAHQAAYDNSARGKMYAGDTGRMVRDLGQFLLDKARDEVFGSKLSEAAPPEELEKISADLRTVADLPGLLAEHGLILAGEVRAPSFSLESLFKRIGGSAREEGPGKMQLPDFVALAIVPDAGAKAEPLFAALRLALGHQKFSLQQSRKINRAMVVATSAEIPVTFAWWVEGGHAVVFAGNVPIEGVLRRMGAGGPGLTEHPLYRRLGEFREFTPITRGFVDGAGVVAALAKVLPEADPQTWAVFEALGFTHLKTATFQFGFEGPTSRAWLELECPKNPRGLATVIPRVPLKLDDLPPLPADAIRWGGYRMDFTAVYDGLLALFSLPDGPADPKARADRAELLRSRRDDAERDLDQALGVKLRSDLIAALGDKLVTYSSPGENLATAVGTGQVIALSVKDEPKVRQAMQRLASNLGTAVGAKARPRVRKYHGIDIHELYFERNAYFAPSYAICDGWLVVSLYPQPVQGFVLRSKGKLPAWKPDARTAAILAKRPADAVGIQYSDPVTSLKQLLTTAPVVLGAALESESLDGVLEVGSIPNAHEATRTLFPNVTWLRHDGKTFRFDAHDSFPLPLEFIGPETIMPYFLFFGRLFF